MGDLGSLLLGRNVGRKLIVTFEQASKIQPVVIFVQPKREGPIVFIREEHIVFDAKIDDSSKHAIGLAA